MAVYRINTLRRGDTNLRIYITTVQDGWRKCAFLTRACFPCKIDLITQYIKPVTEWFCWRMFKETWPHSELTFRHRASSIYRDRRFATLQRTLFIYLINKYISLADICWTVHHWYKKYKQPNRYNNNGLLIIPVSSTCFGKLFYTSSGALDCVLQFVV